MTDLQRMETEAQKNPSNFENILTLSSFYNQMQQPARATNLSIQSLQLADQALARTRDITDNNVAALAQISAQMGNMPKLEPMLQKLVTLTPATSRNRITIWPRWKPCSGKSRPAVQHLQTALDMSATRLKTEPAARDLLVEARKDRRFNRHPRPAGISEARPAVNLSNLNFQI